MANTKYYWLRLKENFFRDKRIKKLRKIAGGDTYTIIYLKMQLLSLQDEGNLYYENIEDSFEEEIALQIDEDVEDVRITLGFLLRSGLLKKNDDNIYELVETKCCIGSETAVAERVRKSREKKKNEEQNLLQCNTPVTNCNTLVTNCNTEIEIEIEKEIEKKKEIEIEKKKDKRKNIIELYNSICTNLPQVKKSNEKRNKAIDKFIKTFNIDEITEIFNIANCSEFLTGENDRGWKADFDFIMRVDKATAILEGKYNNKKKTGCEDMEKIWKETKLEDEQTGNNTNNSFTGW